ncbi:MAG: hypothetical protein IKD37_07210, partial [Clostridia bacterium]|nr:hypothetical protein [Clostridia bacterium]
RVSGSPTEKAATKPRFQKFRRNLKRCWMVWGLKSPKWRRSRRQIKLDGVSRLFARHPVEFDLAAETPPFGAF